MKLVRFWKTDSRFPPEGFAQKIGNGHPARSEICDRQSSGTQQRCAISSAIALADCTWLLDIGDRRMRIGDVQKAASDFLCKAARWNRRDGCLFRISKAEFPLTAAARDADTFVGFHQ